MGFHPIMHHQAEAKNMFLSDYNEQRILEKERAEGLEEGKKKGQEEEYNRRNNEVATDLLKKALFLFLSFPTSASFPKMLSGISPSR